MTIKVLLVDDERLIRAGLAAIIGAEDDLAVAGEAADGAEVPDAVRRLRPDVVLMDVRMPRLDGIQATRRILETVPEPPKIIVVTTFENDEYVYDALKVGANGFLLKRTRPEEILQAIRMVAHGESLLFPAAIRELAARHGPSGGGRGATRWHERLTEREADVLRLMAKGRSNAEIAQELFVSPQTVKTHVGNILGKLQARDRTQAVIFAYETSFITPG
ncbi:response regulator [Actinomadura chibensis]|uniref:Response regulator transcription factor n=1 Tax=Actinomadura chibensis TaxID=392828 RepID=A0A5D0NH64_9ACTN|nr:response regulator transcription factor [Actinomadura chibensis]TYB43595.1 response regulator transcription factor [Actinomadura chibensis]